MRDDTSRTGVIAIPDRGVRDRAQAVQTLDRIAAVADRIDGVWARDVHAGDWVIVRTRNSVYSAAAVGDGTYHVAGGWFTGDRTNLRVGISGCTWGGRVIQTRLVAAPGMFLEFANGVRTTRIQHVRLIPAEDSRTQ
jgi:hypothetical protein